MNADDAADNVARGYRMKLSAKQLVDFCTNAYIAMGVPQADARLLADSLVQAELWGHPSHGVMRTFWYGKRLQSGAMRARTKSELVVDAGAIAVMDGNEGIGQVIATRAMQEAIARAEAHGIGVVAVRNSGHFGTAMYYTRMAAQAGCIGFLTTNGSPSMAPWGGRTKLIGNNPWSIAAPAGKYAPMMLDIANTVVARGKLHVARKKGESIPLGWAVDKEGRPTTDAAEGIAGNILPFAGHKGYAASIMMDVLSGILSGSHFADTIVGPYSPEGKSGVGHFVWVLDIAAFRPLAAFEADMETLVEKIKGSPPAVKGDEIYYPGELEARADARSRSEGIALPDDVVSELNAQATALGVRSLS
ncbi:Ldh family oxidoreductase [Thioalkalivibrio sp. HK1]|uniref:Ldh family oxidoreductase n=1 Tax=Thioalkalivibrio sp. HK1 TaxID=1469245 RepID=UPI000470D83D|nr:Ldh family oxidoreductase [Thioalkalivibrio sp. HK1]